MWIRCKRKTFFVGNVAGHYKSRAQVDRHLTISCRAKRVSYALTDSSSKGESCKISGAEAGKGIKTFCSQICVDVTELHSQQVCEAGFLRQVSTLVESCYERENHAQMTHIVYAGDPFNCAKVRWSTLTFTDPLLLVETVLPNSITNRTFGGWCCVYYSCSFACAWEGGVWIMLVSIWIINHCVQHAPSLRFISSGEKGSQWNLVILMLWLRQSLSSFDNYAPRRKSSLSPWLKLRHVLCVNDAVWLLRRVDCYIHCELRTLSRCEDQKICRNELHLCRRIWASVAGYLVYCTVPDAIRDSLNREVLFGHLLNAEFYRFGTGT